MYENIMPAITKKWLVGGKLSEFREEEGYLPTYVRYDTFGSMGVLHIFGYVTFYFGYCIGYYIDVLLFVARTPDPRNTTAPRRSKRSPRSSVADPAN